MFAGNDAGSYLQLAPWMVSLRHLGMRKHVISTFSSALWCKDVLINW